MILAMRDVITRLLAEAADATICERFCDREVLRKGYAEVSTMWAWKNSDLVERGLSKNESILRR
jgi:hypothetical protein